MASIKTPAVLAAVTPLAQALAGSSMDREELAANLFLLGLALGVRLSRDDPAVAQEYLAWYYAVCQDGPIEINPTGLEHEHASIVQMLRTALA